MPNALVARRNKFFGGWRVKPALRIARLIERLHNIHSRVVEDDVIMRAFAGVPAHRVEILNPLNVELLQA